MEENLWGVGNRRVKEQFLKFGKLLPHPREFDHHFLPWGRELDKKIAGWPEFARSKKGPVKLITQVKIAHLFLQSVSNQFYVIVLSMPM